MDERPGRTDAVSVRADTDLDAWLDALRRGPDVPLPERLETPPIAPPRRWKPIAARALLAAAALIVCTAVVLRLRGSGRTETETGGPGRIAAGRGESPPLSAFRRLTRARTIHLEAWSSTIRHDNEGTQIAGHRLVALGE